MSGTAGLLTSIVICAGFFDVLPPVSTATTEKESIPVFFGAASVIALSTVFPPKLPVTT